MSTVALETGTGLVALEAVVGTGHAGHRHRVLEEARGASGLAGVALRKEVAGVAGDAVGVGAADGALRGALGTLSSVVVEEADHCWAALVVAR